MTITMTEASRGGAPAVRGRWWSHSIIAAAALLTVASVASCRSATGVEDTTSTAVDGPRPTEPFREEHARIKEHLLHLEVMVGDLGELDLEEARGRMGFVVSFLDEHIREHATWEERVLYPVVDDRAGSAVPPFTASMQYEHGIIGRGIEDLKVRANQMNPDVVEFARRADRLLGIIGAHFEKEEEVFLPILDRTMTLAEFEREVGGDLAE